MTLQLAYGTTLGTLFLCVKWGYFQNSAHYYDMSAIHTNAHSPVAPWRLVLSRQLLSRHGGSAFLEIE